MECATCQLRTAAGKCVTCGKPVCESCGIPCDHCRAWSCSGHATYTKAGRALCKKCAQTSQAGTPPAQAPAQPAGPPKAAVQQQSERVAPLSFEALQKEFGPTPTQAAPPETDAEPGSESESAPETAPAPGAHGQGVVSTGEPRAHGGGAGTATEPDPHRRVLSASAPKGTPMWLSGLFAAGIAWILLMPLLTGTNIFHNAQPYMSYVIAFLGVGTGLWSLSGALDRDAESSARWLCVVGLVLSLLAALVALLVRNPPGPA